MKVAKSLLLGSVAGFAAVAAAQAADLPSRKSAPVEYVKVCDAYGAGFFYIPGTDTCLRVGGYVRAEYAYVSPGKIAYVPNGTVTSASGVTTAGVPVSQGGVAGSNAALKFTPSGNVDQTGFMARGRVDLDARTQTAWGTVRTFIGMRLAANGGLYSNGGVGAATGVSVTGTAGGTLATLENAIIQFAGFTFGRTTAEIFSFVPPYNYNTFNWSGFPGAVSMLAYTASFGGGFSATLGIENRSDMAASTQPAFMVNGVSAGALGANFGAAGGVTNGPYTWPALVGNIRVDQGWGTVQLMGGVIQNAATTAFLQAPVQKTITDTGWAVGAGLKLNLPMIGSGDTLYLTGAYTDGALDWISGGFTSSDSTGNLYKDMNGLLRRDVNQSVFLHTTGTCAVAATWTSSCVSSETTSGYSFGGIFTHYWTPTIRTNILASYQNTTPGNVTRHTDWTLGGLSQMNMYVLGGQVVWSPVKDLNIGTELSYTRLNQSLTGNGTSAPSAIPVSWGGFNPSSGIFQGRIRVDRLF